MKLLDVYTRRMATVNLGVLNFREIFEQDVDQLDEELKQENIKEITISARQTNLLDILVMFERKGWKIDRLVRKLLG